MEARRYDVAIPLIGFNPSGGVRMIIHIANAVAARGLSAAISVPSHAASPPIPLCDDVALIASSLPLSLPASGVRRV